MIWTLAQRQALKAHIAANTNTITIDGSPVEIRNVAQNPDNAFAIAAWYNLMTNPAYVVWRTSVFESEFTKSVSSEGTSWSWTLYISRSQGERDAWARLFMGGGTGMNPSLTNVRQGLADIFSGAPAAPQRTHMLVIARRSVTNFERIYTVAATGPGNDGVVGNRGTATNPDALVLEGTISGSDVESAWNS